MDNNSILETLSISFSLIALFFIPITLFTIIILIKRHGFYVSVNCWFCNSWTKVRYTERNSFYCPCCSQYNGFDDDGNYNKVIEAQYDTSFSKCNKTTNKTDPLTNGLCTYCNNNQQLKVYQLANFVPLNENNYDVEIEHFEKQLEKAYKLCKKCDKVLKTTIEKQYAWIFGNRIKNLRKGLLLLNKKSLQGAAKRNRQSFILRIIKYILIVLSLSITCYILDITVNFPTDKIRKLIPDTFVPYTLLLNDLYNFILKAVDNGITKWNIFLPKNFTLHSNDFLLISCVGFLLEIFVMIYDQRSIWWKFNELLGWILLIITSSVPLHENYILFVNGLQVFCSVAIAYSLSQRQHVSPAKKKFEFKKLSKNFEETHSSDEEIPEESASFSSSKKLSSCRSFKGNSKSIASFHQSPSGTSHQFSFQNKVQKTAKLNDSFTTARNSNSASVLNNSFKTASSLSTSGELHRSLENLHLSNLNFKPQACTSPTFTMHPGTRPILSPAKLKNITQNPWTAGGFWKNDASQFQASAEFTNLSRSSSQTSGFVSNNDLVNNNPFSSLPASRQPSLCGDFERSSFLSEPTYHFQPINSNGFNTSQLKNNLTYHPLQPSKSPLPSSSGQLYYQTSNNIFYPVLNQSNMLYIQGSTIPHCNFENSFSNLSLKSFNAKANSFNSPTLFDKPPATSSLFKNLSGNNTLFHSINTPLL